MKDRERKYLFILIILMLGILAAFFLSIMVGSVFIHPALIVKILAGKLMGGLIQPTWDRLQETIVLDIRLPRVILSLLVGMALAMSGAVMQALFRNPMAEPYILGMSSGAALGATLAIVLGLGAKAFGYLSISMLAFIGATITIFVVYNIARTEGRVPTETLLLSGIAVGFFLHAVVSFLKIIATHEALRDVVLWLMGSFAVATWFEVKIAVFPILFGIGGLYLFYKELNALQFGEEQALYLGVKVEIIKRLMLIFVALLTAISVSISGIIGFVGLIIPHIIRLLIGPDHRILLPASCLAGGLFLILADTLARTIVQSAEVPIGIITASIGAPYFIYLLRRRKKAISWW